MGVVNSFLPEEDLKAYQASREEPEPAIPPWRETIAAWQFGEDIPEPASVPDYLALEVFNADRGRAANRIFNQDLGQTYINAEGYFDIDFYRRDKFVVDVEKAFYSTRGRVPLSFFVEHADDLALLGPEFSKEVEQLHQLALAETQRVQASERGLEDMTRAQEILSRFEEAASEFNQAAPSQAGSGMTLIGPEGAQRAQSFLGTVIGKPLGWASGLIGGFVEKTQYINPASAAVVAGVRGLGSRLETDEQREIVLAMEAEIGRDLDSFILINSQGDAMEHWQQMEQKDRDVWVAMAGGDTTMGRAMFVDAALFSDENRKHAAEQKKIYDAQLEYQIKELKNEDFTISEGLLNIIAAWGNAIDYLGAATIVGIQDLIQDGSVNVFDSQFWQDVSDADTPSKALGFDGTLIGLGVDLIMGAALDPTTVFFGPRIARAGRAGVGSVDDAIRAAQSSTTRQYAEETLNAAASVTRDHSALISMTDNMLGTGNASRLYATLDGFTNKVAFDRGWLNTPLAGATEDIYYKFIDDVIEITDDVVKKAETVLDKPVMPVEITYNPTTSKYAVTKNAETYVALRKNFADAIPTTFKIDENFGLVNSTNADDWAERLGAIDGMIAPSELEDLLRYDFRLADDTTDAARAQFEATEAAYADDIAQVVRNIEEPNVQRIVRSGIVGNSYSRAEQIMARIKEGNLQGRAWKPPTPTDDVVKQRALVEDVRQNGVNKPISIAVDPDTRAVTVLNGNHRLSAALDAGVDLVPIRVGMKKKLADVPGLEGRPAPRAPKVLDDPPLVGDPLLESSPYFQGALPDKHVIRTIGKNKPATKKKPAEVQESFVRPSELMGDDIFGPKKAVVDDLIELEQHSLLMGGDPSRGRLTVAAMAIGNTFRSALRNTKSKNLRHLDDYITPVNANVMTSFTGAGWEQVLHSTGVRVWAAADDFSTFRHYQTRIFEFLESRGMRLNQIEGYKLDKARLANERAILSTETGGTLDDWVDFLGIDDADDAVRAAHKQVTDRLEAIEEELLAIDKKIGEAHNVANSFAPLTRILDEMWDEFNRKHIASRPEWEDFVDEKTGLVPWEKVTGRDPTNIQTLTEDLERGYIPDTIQKVYEQIGEELGMTLEQFVQETTTMLKSPQAYRMPASALEMMTAANAGSNTLKRLQHRTWIHSVGQGAETLQLYWAMDKVITPRTGIVVSFDELQRIAHMTGGTNMILRFLQDQLVMKAEALTRLKGGDAWNKIPVEWQRRLQSLEEYPSFYRQLERSFLETSGWGHNRIEFAKHGVAGRNWRQASQRQSTQWLNERGYQAYLLEDADGFAKWWQTDEAAKYRTATYFDAKDGVNKPVTQEMVRTFFSKLEEWSLSNIKGDKNAARKVWRDSAERARAAGSTKARSVELPEWVNDGWGVVTGNAARNRPGMGFFNWASDKVFQNPMNYRRGHLAEAVRVSENARLEKLFASQGKRIIPHAEYERLARQMYPHLNNGQIKAVARSLDDEMREYAGVVSQRYVDELVETKVISEMENAMYSFQMTSRAGRSAKHVAPFGKPWADMMGVWGRELVTRPTMRGWFRNADEGTIRKGMSNFMEESFPFNPKTAAFLSRIAATDFDLENIDDDPIVGRGARAIGLEELDLASIMFLPNQGNNLFGVLLPGLGWIPTGAMQGMAEVLAPDPVDDPIAYQDFIDSWGQFLPSLGYNKADSGVDFLLRLFAGGGTAARFAQGSSAGLALIPGQLGFEGGFAGSLGPRVDANRRVMSMVWNNPDILSELSQLPPEAVELSIRALLNDNMNEITDDAVSAMAVSELKELVGEFWRPGRMDFGAGNDQLADAWIESVSLMGLELPSHINTDTEAGKRGAADWARSRFFELPSWERDALVAATPGLAVNLVSMYEWTDKAKRSAKMQEYTSTPYRSGGSTEDFRRHQSFQQLGYIQPVTPYHMLQNIIGTISNARVNAARELYVEAATQVNEYRWETEVSDEAKEYLNSAASLLSETGVLPYEDAKTMWRNLGDLEAFFDLNVPDNEWSFPSKQRPWGESMPHTADALREEFREGYPALVNDKMRTLLRTFGYADDLDVIEMSEVYDRVASTITEDFIENPAYATVLAGYNVWLQPRSAGLQATQNYFGRILDGDAFDNEARWQHKQTLIYVEEALARKRMGDDSWLQVRDEAVQRFGALTADDAFANQPVAQLWNQAWGKSLGEFDWEPPEPPPIDEGDRVYVAKVIDGDTIDITRGNSILPGREFTRLRLLGFNAAEMNTDEGQAARRELVAKVRQAVEAGIPITVVPDERFGRTDLYGREFGWLYIGDEVWYDPDTMIPGSS